MDAYHHRSGDDEHRLAIYPSEGRILHVLRPFSPFDPGVLLVHEEGVVRRVRRDALLLRVRRQIEALRGCEDRLPFKYAVARRFGDRFYPDFGSGSRPCEERRVAEELGLPVDERWLGRGTVMIKHERHDLRDMRPITIDRGVVVRATRRRWDTTIVEKIAALGRFLEAAAEPWIEVFVVVNA